MKYSKLKGTLIVCAAASALFTAATDAAAQTQSDVAATPPPVPTQPGDSAEAPPVERSQPPLVLRPLRVPPMGATWWTSDAERPVSAAPIAPRMTSEWYGWQTLAVDGSSLAFGLLGLGLGLVARSTELVLLTSSLSLLGLVVGSPIVHWYRGNTTKGFISLFGLRLGLMAAGYVVGGAALLPVLGFYSLIISGPALAGLGLIIGAIVDASVVARDQRPAADPPMPTRSWSLLPMMINGQMAFGAAGTF